jgi:hypothetical protein
MKLRSFPRLLFVLSVLSLGSIFISPARADDPVIETTIDFEVVPNVTPAPSFFQLTDAPLNSYLSDQLLNETGVRFYSEAPNPAALAYVQLGQGHATSGEFGVATINTESKIDYNVPLMASFFVKDNPLLPAVTDIVSISGDLASCCETLTIEAYNANGLLLATSTTVAGDTPLVIAAPGIHTVRVTEESGTVAWDDFAFGALRPVPEPSTLALLTLAGLAGAGAIVRKRRW